MERTIKPVDCLVIVGHGIEKVIGTRTDPTKPPRWQPTRLFYKLDKRGLRTGFRERGITVNDSDVIVAGGVAETLAAAELIDRMQKATNPFKLIIFAAGRPAYIQEHEPDNLNITEGRVMEKYLDEKVKVSKPTKKVFLDSNRNTQDDISISLQVVHQMGVRSVKFLTLDIRQPRCKALLENTLAKYPEYHDLQIDFAVAEDILRLRYQTHYHLFERILDELKASKAYQALQEREQQGIDALQNGSYKERVPLKEITNG